MFYNEQLFSDFISYRVCNTNLNVEVCCYHVMIKQLGKEPFNVYKTSYLNVELFALISFG